MIFFFYNFYIQYDLMSSINCFIGGADWKTVHTNIHLDFFFLGGKGEERVRP